MKKYEIIPSIFSIICVFVFSLTPYLLLEKYHGNLFSIITVFCIIFGLSFFITGIKGKINTDVLLKDTIIGIVAVLFISIILIIGSYETMGIFSYLIILMIFAVRKY